MSVNNTEICARLDSFIKKSLKNETKYYERQRNVERKRTKLISELNNQELQHLAIYDKYPSETFAKTITVECLNAVIHNELLYTSLLSLKQDNLNVILLKYWLEITDSEIAVILNMSRRMVNHHKNKGLKKLKELMNDGK